MIHVAEFRLDDQDFQSLVPNLSCFDYYFVVTLWPMVADEKDKIRRTVGSLRSSELIFAEPVDGFDLCNMGFHLRRTTSKEVVEELKGFGDLLVGLARLAGDKQLAGQDIGIYIHDVSRGREQASNTVREIGKVVAHTITSNKFGNLSYPPEGREITHILTDQKREETVLVSCARLSSNEIIYEFGGGDRSRHRSLGAIDALRSLWNAPCQIHDALDRDSCTAEFWLGYDTVATVGRYDSIEKMNICASVGTYPKVGALAVQLYNEDKRKLPMLTYEDMLVNKGPVSSSPTSEFRGRGLPLPRVKPFIDPKHVLISFSRR